MVYRTPEEIIHESFGRLWFAGCYGSIVNGSRKNVSEETHDYYFKERYPKWIADELADIDPAYMVGLMQDISTQIKDAISSDGFVERIYTKQHGDDGKWHLNYDYENADFIFDRNIPEWYFGYAALLEMALYANICQGKKLTEWQIAKWVVAAVKPSYRYAFARARAANQRVVAGILIANSSPDWGDDIHKRVEEIERVEDYWNKMAKKIRRGKDE